MKSDSPQVLLQMGSSHKGGGVTSTQHSQHLHNGVQSMVTRMESMIQQAIANRDTPKEEEEDSGTPDLGVKIPDYLEEDAYQVMTDAIKQIEDLLLLEKDQNDADWKAAVDAVDTCNKNKKKGYTEANGVDALLKIKDTSCGVHKTCRENEDGLRGTEKEKHDDMETKQNTMMKEADEALGDKPSCDAPENAEGDTYAKSEALETYLGEAREWSANHETDVTNSIDEYTTAATVFGRAADAAAGVAATCDTNQVACEKKFCEYKVKLNSVCSTHRSCVARGVKAREEKRVLLQDKETAEKIILQSCSKVTCYINLMKKGEGEHITQEKYDGCRIKKDGTPLVGTFDGLTWDADGDKILNINWVTKIDGSGCDEGPVSDPPGSANWKDKLRKESKPTNAWLTGKEGIRSSQDCSEHLAGQSNSE